MGFFDVGFLELLVILIVALLVFGPNKLPELGRNLGKAVSKFSSALRQTTSEVRQEGQDITTEVNQVRDELQRTRRELWNELKRPGDGEEGTDRFDSRGTNNVTNSEHGQNGR